MLALRFLLPLAFVFVLIGTGSAQEKKETNKEKIVGTWELVKTVTGEKTDTLPPGSEITVEFTKDGKIITNLKLPGNAQTLKGIYEVDGDMLTSKIADEKPFTAKIKSLTDKELVIEQKKGADTSTTWYKRK
jgi:uncharacterized protein (TIGR03066 family)